MYLKLYNVGTERNFYNSSADFSVVKVFVFLEWPVVPFTQSRQLD